jgi:hypothetical protein
LLRISPKISPILHSIVFGPPRGLLGVVELGGAAGFLAEHVVDVLESLFEHGGTSVGRWTGDGAGY